MSSTGRGTQRKDYDKYYTPDWLVDEGIKIAKKWLSYKVAPKILEPCCGGGAIVVKLQKTFTKADIRFCDISPDEDFPCEKEDFLNRASTWSPNAIISNPPYNAAQDIITKALEISAVGGYVIMLLRVNFFGGQKRSAWLARNMPIEMHVSPRRPSFTGKSTDSTEYAWFVWEKGTRAAYTKTFLLDTATARFKN